MFGFRKILGSIFLAVIFLALACVAAISYSGNQKQQTDITSSPLFQKGKATAAVLMGASETMADANLQKNVGFGKTMADAVSRVNWQGIIKKLSASSTEEVNQDETETVANTVAEDITSPNKDVIINQDNVQVSNNEVAAPATQGKSNSAWSDFKNTVKEEWDNSQKSDETQTNTASVKAASPLENSIGKNYFNYEKTKTGAEIIIKSKTGEEYKLPLPFKFLSQS